MKEGVYEISILKYKEGPGKRKKYEEYQTESEETVIATEPNQSFTVRVSVDREFQVNSSFYIVQLYLDGKPLNYCERIQCLPGVTKGSVEFRGFETPEGRFSFKFAPLTTTNVANSSNLENDSALGTIEVEIFEAFPTEQPAQYLRFDVITKEKTPILETNLTTEQHAEAIIEVSPSSASIPIDHSEAMEEITPEPAKPKVFEDLTEGSEPAKRTIFEDPTKKYWKTPALVTVQGDMLCGPRSTPKKEKESLTKEVTTSSVKEATDEFEFDEILDKLELFEPSNVEDNKIGNRKRSNKKKETPSTSSKPQQKLNKLSFLWNEGELLQTFKIRYQTKERLQFCVPEIRDELDKKRKRAKNQNKKNQSKTTKKLKLSSEEVTLQELETPETPEITEIPYCDLTMDGESPQWNSITINNERAHSEITHIQDI
jgi:hypothetical protein